MQTQVHEFFDKHVLPNLKDWKSQPTDLRLAMNTVVSLYHMADHFWHAYSSVMPDRVFDTKNSSKFRSELGNRNNCFKILRDVAEAHKHMKLDRKSPSLTQASQTDIGAIGFGEGGFGTGPFGGGPSSIIVELDSGEKLHLSFLVEKVKQLWLSLLK